MARDERHIDVHRARLLVQRRFLLALLLSPEPALGDAAAEPAGTDSFSATRVGLCTSGTRPGTLPRINTKLV